MADKRKDDDQRSNDEPQGELKLKERTKTQKPNLYRVLLHNDDYTTMEFVVAVLVELFNKTQTEATHIMLHIHHKGVGVCGLYTRDIAETKVEKVTEMAREYGHPLLCTMEPE
ncbi:MAG: ATP-dependent Clp protease adapter ClpS [Deltaproteobacteria bacterium]|nr:ATP-dependent Clp protease adapter ClpS [Deltaproteobacteria bacterium]